MALPGVTTTIQDPGLGAIPANTGLSQVKLGVCNVGTPNVLQGLGSVAAAKTALGDGPLLDAVVQVLQVAGGPVYAMPLLPSLYGTVGTAGFTNAGVGSGTIAATLGPENIVKVKIIGGGTLTNATFQVAIGSGNYGATVTTAATYQVPGQYFTTLGFAAGTYVANDVYQLNLDGTVTRTGSGTATLLNGSTHTPVDAYKPQVRIVTAGAVGTAAFQYSLDSGNTWSGTILSSATYVIPNTGLVLAFTGASSSPPSFVVGDVYSNTTITGPGYASGDVTTAFTASTGLLANPTQWGFVHLVGQASSASGAATIASVVDTQMTAAFAQFRFARAVVECPTTEADSAVLSAFASFQSARVGIAAADVDLVSPLTGRIDRRNCAWAVTARMSQNSLSTDPGQVNLGKLANVVKLYRDENATPGLFDARFITVRSFIGRNGYYCAGGLTMAAPGSDYSKIMNGRVMDRICAVAYNAYMNFVNASVRIDDNTGFIDERDAQAIDGTVTGQLKAAVKDSGDVSDVTSVVSRTDNLLSTSTLNAEVSAIPLGYLTYITVKLGFKNPLLTSAAA